MISRIVKLFFEEDNIITFLTLFENTKQDIRNFDGCEHLQLLRHQEIKHVLYTYSIWKSEHDLNNYRKSVLFRNTWSQTKVLFSERPIVYTLDQIDWVK